MKCVKLIDDRFAKHYIIHVKTLNQISDSLHVFPELRIRRDPEGIHFLWGEYKGKKIEHQRKGARPREGRQEEGEKGKQLGVY